MSIGQNKYSILLVDDDSQVLTTLEILFSDDYQVILAESGEKAIEYVKNGRDIATVVMDIKMAAMNGITAGRAIRQINADIPIIFHTGYPGDFDEDEIDANEKPFDYVQKGKSVTRLLRSVRNAFDSYIAKKESIDVSGHAEKNYGMIGKSSVMQELYAIIGKVAKSDNKVMILGETGTGKELVARAIHNTGRRHDGKLAILNCNHKAPDIIESELFGHTKGSFTGAVTDRVGLFEFANGGTVFLDEIGDLDITTQAKLLRVLETGEFQPLGCPEIKNTDVRVICATHKNLRKMVEQNLFREDLYYRLKGVVINIPPLRDRKEDIPILVEKFADTFTIQKGMAPKIFDSSAMSMFLEYDWPGNVRQLLDTVESLIVLSDSELIIADDVKNYIEQQASDDGIRSRKLSDRMRELERTLIIEALIESAYSISEAASLLGVERSTFSKKIKSHKIDLSILKNKH